MAANGTDTSALHKKADKQKRELERLLEEFVQQRSNQSNIAAQQRLAAESSELTKTVQLIRQQISEMPEKHRAIWERRANNLEDDAMQIQNSVDKQLGHFYKVRKQEEDKKALLGGYKAKGIDDELQASLKEQSSLRESNLALDECLEQGNSIMGNLIGQNKILKNAQRRLLDITNVMGVSSSLVNVIDRRQTGDKWLVYGGMIFTLFILFSLWYLLRW